MPHESIIFYFYPRDYKKECYCFFKNKEKKIVFSTYFLTLSLRVLIITLSRQGEHRPFLLAFLFHRQVFSTHSKAAWEDDHI